MVMVYGPLCTQSIHNDHEPAFFLFCPPTKSVSTQSHIGKHTWVKIPMYTKKVRLLTVYQLNRFSLGFPLKSKLVFQLNVWQTLRSSNLLNVFLLFSLFSGGPLHLGDIEKLGEAALLCIVCPWHSWKYCLETGRLKVPQKKNITLGTYPVKISDKGEFYLGFKSLSPDYFNGGIDF